ncbi:nucleotidyltransferase domain-containing protein [Plebeiibacterium marinum]|uniref:Nucleotidyltransferase domain-containing protein n=1 Tax=Plebeiibacterium marinum TaxID=2992111 RepID=A0AAE3MHD0_9BACT|nr:nucleotidyltransferase domain-containing protein [Plebeiobacterium marinum]MCW3807993.1 nucleotidyltransferase domain-containing protein [Plebeiobacterium marinum]
MYGLKETHINKLNSVFANYPAIRKAILYGSRAKGNYREGSDIDISLVGDKLNLNMLLRIETELDDLLLPYNIDISIFDKIENQELIEHIKRVGIILYKE